MVTSSPIIAELSADGRQDAVHYAKEFNVSQEEAERRLTLQDSVGSLKALQVPGYTLGVWLEHEDGTSHIVGWYSSAELNFEPVIAAAAAKGLPFELRTDAPHSEEGMVALAALGVEMIKGRGYTVAGSGVLNRSASILVQVMGSEENPGSGASLVSLARELRDAYGVEFDLRVVESAGDDATYGGRIITSASEPACSTGFTVANYIGIVRHETPIGKTSLTTRSLRLSLTAPRINTEMCSG